MEYSQLLQGLSYTGCVPKGQASVITQDSRKVQPGAVFVCVQGQSSDGHNYAQKALQAGAGLLVTQRKLGLPNEVTVPDSRKAYSLLCQAYFGYPAQKLCITAVTGTNGKTTVAFVIQSLLQQMGIRCGLIGTVHTQIGAMQIPAKFTTPEAWDLNALFARMVAAGCSHAVIEASSQALAQDRLYGLQFALGIFTNLTQDHLDYHGTMQNYYEAKKILFGQCDVMLANADDEWGKKLLQQCDMPRCSFGLTPRADFSAGEIRLGAAGVDFTLQTARQTARQTGGVPVHFAMPGEFSVYNALAALGAVDVLGTPANTAATQMGKVAGVPGRSEVLHSGSFTILRDFAHTGDAIEKFLSALRPYTRGRLVVLFGCPGQRDREKRPVMSRAAAQYGDVIIYTADNPRAEPFQQIQDDALPPLQEAGKPYYVQQNREKAVVMALEMLQPGDVLALCGKGHEDYQALDGETIYLSEKTIVHNWLAQNNHR